jgi:hypothetical protein
MYLLSLTLPLPLSHTHTLPPPSQDLFTLFKNLSKIAFPEALSFVGQQLQSVTTGASHTFQEVEVAVVLLYELGEGAPEEALKPDRGSVGRVGVALLQVCSSPLQGGAVFIGGKDAGGGEAKVEGSFGMLAGPQHILTRPLSVVTRAPSSTTSPRTTSPSHSTHPPHSPTHPLLSLSLSHTHTHT